MGGLLPVLRSEREAAHPSDVPLVVVQPVAEIDLDLGREVDLILHVERLRPIVDERRSRDGRRCRAAPCVSAIVVMSIGAIVRPPVAADAVGIVARRHLGAVLVAVELVAEQQVVRAGTPNEADNLRLVLDGPADVMEVERFAVDEVLVRAPVDAFGDEILVAASAGR